MMDVYCVGEQIGNLEREVFHRGRKILRETFFGYNPIWSPLQMYGREYTARYYLLRLSQSIRPIWLRWSIVSR